MIRAEILYDIRPVYEAQLFIQAFPGLLEETVIAAFNRDIKPGFLKELQYEPPPAKLPFEFETAKSRRYYFWAVRSGKIKTANGRYVRTHKLSRGWDVGISADDEMIVMSAQNRRKYEKYVTGPRQVKGHRNTGWPLRQQIVDFWTDAALETTLQTVDQLLINSRF